MLTFTIKAKKKVIYTTHSMLYTNGYINGIQYC